jgi:hypothetical protein
MHTRSQFTQNNTVTSCVLGLKTLNLRHEIPNQQPTPYHF